jgi:hypothetical protein
MQVPLDAFKGSSNPKTYEADDASMPSPRVISTAQNDSTGQLLTCDRTWHKSVSLFISR